MQGRMQDKRADGAGEMPTIDLTLAINYLPAVECFVKVTVLAGALCLANVTEHLGAFSIMAMMLAIDSALSTARIFDGNALQCAVLLSFFVNTLRLAASAPPAVVMSSTGFWALAALLLVVESREVQEYLVLYGQGGGGRLRQILPGVGSSLMIGLFAFLPGQRESSAVKMARALGFAALCMLWVYVVTVWRARPRQHGVCVFASHALIARFAPVLYLHAVVAAVYALACLALLVYHHVQLHYKAPPEPSVTVLNTIHTIPEEDEEDLEALLRTAKQQQQ